MVCTVCVYDLHVFTLFIWTLNTFQSCNLLESRALLRTMSSAVYLIVMSLCSDALSHPQPHQTPPLPPLTTTPTSAVADGVRERQR